MNDKPQPRDLLISAIEHLDNAREDFERGASKWPGHDAAMASFYSLREAMIDALAPHYALPAHPDEDSYNVAQARWDALKEACELGGLCNLLSATAARAFAEAAELAELDWERRQAADPKLHKRLHPLAGSCGPAAADAC